MEQNKIPTAWELAQEAVIEYEGEISEIENPESLKSIIQRLMITHTKLHVEAALKAASEKAQAYNKISVLGGKPIYKKIKVNKDSILNAYPLDEIK